MHSIFQFLLPRLTFCTDFWQLLHVYKMSLGVKAKGGEGSLIIWKGFFLIFDLYFTLSYIWGFPWIARQVKMWLWEWNWFSFVKTFTINLSQILVHKYLSVFELIFQSLPYLIWTRQLWYERKNASRLDCTCWKLLSTAGIHTVYMDRSNTNNDLTVAKRVDSEWNQQCYTIYALKESLASKWSSKIL